MERVVEVEKLVQREVRWDAPLGHTGRASHALQPHRSHLPALLPLLQVLVEKEVLVERVVEVEKEVEVERLVHVEKEVGVRNEEVEKLRRDLELQARAILGAILAQFGAIL